MKKIVSMILAVVMILSVSAMLTACSDSPRILPVRGALLFGGRADLPPLRRPSSRQRKIMRLHILA